MIENPVGSAGIHSRCSRKAGANTTLVTTRAPEMQAIGGGGVTHPPERH